MPISLSHVLNEWHDYQQNYFKLNWFLTIFGFVRLNDNEMGRVRHTSNLNSGLSLPIKHITMKKRWLIFLMMVMVFAVTIFKVAAQCSICTKTAQQLGEGPAKSLNTGILYLMFSPLAIMGFIGFRWWKKEKEVLASEADMIG